MPAAVGFLALAVLWTFPLVLHLSTHLPGSGIGDNVLSLWNFWWMRTALASGVNFFYSPYLFVPIGDDLTLYTHTALPALVGATALKGLSLVTAVNVTILAALALNGFCAYLLSWRITRDWGAAMLAGIIFGSSPYIAAHLNGHFNLTAAWTIPLFALTVAEAIRGSMRGAVLSGIVLAMTAYIDYYYVVYEIALAVCAFACAARAWSLTLRARRPYPTWALALVACAITLDVVELLAIVVTGGFSAQLGPLRISMRDAFNPLQVFWILVVLALWMHWRPRVSAHARPGWSWTHAGYTFGAMFGTFVCLAAPLVVNGVRLLLRGEYVTQTYYWRNAPVGIDVATLLLGNPYHSIWGSGVRHLYTALGIDPIESGAWLGIVPLALLVYALRRRWSDPSVREWTGVAAMFFVWALGSHVHAGGRNIGLIMPVTLLRYVPIVANARMPGRAMVVVYLAVAVLGAIGAAQWRVPWRRPALGTLVLATLVFADFLLPPYPIAAVECPAIYQVLRDRPEAGSLAELPLGLGDGFGPLTPVDPHMFACQTIHKRPLVGGVTSRLGPTVLAAYAADPLIAAWLRLSGMRTSADEHPPLPDRQVAAGRLVADGIGFVMLNRQTASPELRQYVEEHLPLTLIAQDGDRALYITAFVAGK